MVPNGPRSSLEIAVSYSRLWLLVMDRCASCCVELVACFQMVERWESFSRIADHMYPAHEMVFHDHRGMPHSCPRSLSDRQYLVESYWLSLAGYRLCELVVL